MVSAAASACPRNVPRVATHAGAIVALRSAVMPTPPAPVSAPPVVFATTCAGTGTTTFPIASAITYAKAAPIADPTTGTNAAVRACPIAYLRPRTAAHAQARRRNRQHMHTQPRTETRTRSFTHAMTHADRQAREHVDARARPCTGTHVDAQLPTQARPSTRDRARTAAATSVDVQAPTRAGVAAEVRTPWQLCMQECRGARAHGDEHRKGSTHVEVRDHAGPRVSMRPRRPVDVPPCAHRRTGAAPLAGASSALDNPGDHGSE